MFKAQFFLILQIARLCHEANREYCISIGDDSQLPWEQAPLWQKISAVKGVLYHLYFFPAYNPQASHESWYREKEADGWKFGPVKDVEKKEHPCMVPYQDLPIEQQLKDALFINIIHAVVKAVGAHRIEANGDPEKRGDRVVCSPDITEEMIELIKNSTPGPDTATDDDDRKKLMEEIEALSATVNEKDNRIGELELKIRSIAEGVTDTKAGSGEPAHTPAYAQPTKDAIEKKEKKS